MLITSLEPLAIPHKSFTFYSKPQHQTNITLQDVDETPDFTEDSDTNPNTTASSVVGETLTADGRKRRSEATQLRRSVFGKKHDRLGESKVWHPMFKYTEMIYSMLTFFCKSRKMILSDDFDISLV
jgi:hypothetical protein